MKLFIKSIIYFCIPILVLVGIYIWSDPFKVIHHYDTYLSDYVMLDRGYVSTKVFLKNRHIYHFDSFILGSSRSCAFTSREWDKYLPAGSRAYSYGAWNENIEGIHRKLKLIDSLNNPINHVLIIIDVDYTFSDNNTLEYEHYLVSGRTLTDFHLKYFSQYLRNYWLIPESIDYKIFRKKRLYMKNFIGMKPGDLDPVNNNWLPNSEFVINKDSVEYYKNADKIFYKRPKIQRQALVQINRKDSLILQDINRIFMKNKTAVKIIIGPLYDQI
ncbi:MAG: hypothetical protein J7L04_06915, partial [Bacteroidales bacterium]|nr:hypothetical protein [Bacteroidales bacterium]